MVHEIGVEGVVSGDQHHQRPLPAPPGAATLLPERGDGAREPRDDHGVEAGDVHSEFECVGSRHAEQTSVRDRRFEVAAIFREVTGAVGGDAVDEVGC